MNQFHMLERRWFAWFSVVFVGLFSLGVILTSYSGFQTSGVWYLLTIPAGLLFFGVSVWVYFRFLGYPERLGITTVNGSTEIKVWRKQLAGSLIFLGLLALTTAWGFVTSVALDELWWPWAVGFVLTAILLPQVIRSILRRPALILTPEEIRYRGPTVDSALAWDDAPAIFASRTEQAPCIFIRGRQPSASWRWACRYWVTKIEREKRHATIVVEAQGPREVYLTSVLLPLLVEYQRTPRIRSELGTSRFLERYEAAMRRELVNSTR